MPYLGYYLDLVDDDRRGVLEDGPLPCHFTTWEEEFLEIGAVRFERLATFLYQGVESRLNDIVLVEIGSVAAGVPPPFVLNMCEVVDSPVESPKCVATWNKQELKAPPQNYEIRTVRFGKPDDPVLSGPMTIRGVTDLWRGAPPLTKQRLDGGDAWTTTTLRLGRRLVDLIEEK
jgi:hypothetical protein